MSDKRSKIENEFAIMPSRRTKSQKISNIVSFSNFKIKMTKKKKKKSKINLQEGKKKKKKKQIFL